MEFQHSEKALHWQERVRRFLDDKVLPREAEYWAQVREDSTRQPPAMETVASAGLSSLVTVCGTEAPSM